MAPNLKGRPRKKKPFSQRRDSFNGAKDSSSNCDAKAVAKVKCEDKSALLKPKSNNNNCKKPIEGSLKVSIGECKAEEQTFLVALYKYMKERKTPIERIPYLGFKQINLWTMFQAAQKLGGYETITARRQWKHVYDELGGNPGSTSAATCTRRHYERLILPYERFTKGEEDKPLPPVKPRKQEQGAQEGELKPDLSSAKHVRVDSKKGKKEKNNVQKPQDPCEVSLDHGSQEVVEEEHEESDDHAQKDAEKQPEKCLSLAQDTTEFVSTEKLDMLEVSSSRDEKEEIKEEQETSVSSDLSDSKSEPGSYPSDEHSNAKIDKQPAVKQEQSIQSFTDPVGKEPASFTIFPDIHIHVQNPKMEDDNLPQLPDYVANCTVKMDPLVPDELKSAMDSNILQNALKQNTKVYVVQSLDILKEKELPATGNENSTFNYAPLLYSRGNPGIMSPLAKKKLLSQVSGASLSSSYPYGSPPPLISKKRTNELSASGQQTSHGCIKEPVSINRPSVIQHVQSFKTKYEEERPPTNDCTKQSPSSKSDGHHCDFTKPHKNTHIDSYVLKTDGKKNPGQHSRVANFLEDFYSSPHLHKLYKQTEHHLHGEKSAKSFSRDMLWDSERKSTFSQQKHHDKNNLSYHPPLHQQEKLPVEISTDEQPTDLSLPKTINKQSGSIHGVSLPHTMVQYESKPILLKYKSENSHTVSSDCTPNACRVLPMITTPKKVVDSSPRSGPSHNMRLESSRRVEGAVHPMPTSKTVNIGMARPLKRTLDDLHNDSSEKKIRIVSPLHMPKETVAREKISNPGGERSKTVQDSNSDSMLEGHKYPVSSPMFPGFYPGTLCSGLSSRIPAAYSHPLQYLKNQTMYSPVMQPISLHSFMVQRQLLASSANSQQLYRHLAAGAPVGSSYGELLHNNMYPLASINSQNAFSSSQLSSVHPSTKL
ncbi:AT-rich interactive domain-containing protein 5B isoform X2 [Pleurodeles waltl]|uniref:AT-rich interactive domain-containing protein 5B isoform X2 n=1 Tax=Pleurodeles waltl TaxID=8319 RepID=UPI00370965F4